MKSVAVAILAGVILMANPLGASSAPADGARTATVRDGHKDFDFLIGRWHTHYMRLRNPLHGSHDWYGCDGSSVVRPFWQGSGDLEDGDLRCPRRYIQGMTLRLYSDTTHQWSLYWGTKKNGLALPPQVGHFDRSGVGDFFANDTFDGKAVIVRYRWSLLRGLPHFEQAFSTDHGRTWETNWTTDYIRA